MKRRVPHKVKPNYINDVDWADPLNKWLVHFWPFAERAIRITVPAKDIIGGYDASTIGGGTTYPSPVITDKRHALSADGGDQLGTTAPPTYNNNFTVEFLFRERSISGFGTVISDSGNNGFFTSSNQILYYVGGSRAISAITNGEWTHVMCTFTPNGVNADIQMYVNGVASGSTPNIAVAFKPTTLFGHGSEYLDADISYIKIYEGIKTPAQIRALSQNPWQTLPPIRQFIGIKAGVAPIGIEVFRRRMIMKKAA